jgi:hypothetical protein
MRPNFLIAEVSEVGKETLDRSFARDVFLTQLRIGKRNQFSDGSGWPTFLPIKAPLYAFDRSGFATRYKFDTVTDQDDVVVTLVNEVDRDLMVSIRLLEEWPTVSLETQREILNAEG